MSTGKETDGEVTEPVIHIDWGYDTPVARSGREERPAIVRRELTIEPPPIRATPEPEQPVIVSPKVRAPRPDHRIWLATFVLVGLFSAAILTLLTVVLALG